MEQYLDTDVSNKIIVCASLSVQIDKEFNSGSGQPNYAIEHHWMHISKENIERYIQANPATFMQENHEKFWQENEDLPCRRPWRSKQKNERYINEEKWKSLETPTEKSSLEALDNFPHYP